MAFVQVRCSVTTHVTAHVTSHVTASVTTPVTALSARITSLGLDGPDSIRADTSVSLFKPGNLGS